MRSMRCCSLLAVLVRVISFNSFSSEVDTVVAVHCGHGAFVAVASWNRRMSQSRCFLKRSSFHSRSLEKCITSLRDTGTGESFGIGGGNIKSNFTKSRRKSQMKKENNEFLLTNGLRMPLSSSTFPRQSVERRNRNNNSTAVVSSAQQQQRTFPSNRGNNQARQPSSASQHKQQSPPLRVQNRVESLPPWYFNPVKYMHPMKQINERNQLDYARNGHTVLRSFLNADLLRELRRELEQYATQHQIDAWRQKVEVQSGSLELAQSCSTIQECQKVLRKYLPSNDDALQALPFLQYFNTWRSLPNIRDCLTHAPILASAASLFLGCESIRLYQDSLFCKYANQSAGGPTPWHVDARMAPFDTSNMITFWIPFQRTTHTGLVFCSKSHADFSLPFWHAFDSPAWHNLEKRYPPDTSVRNHMPLGLGDVTVHSGWTLHCADAANEKEGDCRMALAITYVDAKATIRSDALAQLNTQTTSNNDQSVGGGGGYGDMEDYWSYRDWINKVPRERPFQHKLVPIVWPIP